MEDQTVELSLDDFMEEGEGSENAPAENSESSAQISEVQPENKAFNGKYSVKQVGSIAHFNEPLNGNAPLETAQQFFEESGVKALPVEENDQIVGIIEKEALEQNSGFWKRLGSSRISDQTIRIAAGLNAEDYIENVMDEALEITQKYDIKYLPVFEKKAFYGLVTFEDFIKRTSEIRDQDLQKASAIQKSFFPDPQIIKTLPYRLSCWNKMANPIGGDMFQVHKISDSKSLVCCADVSGKNVAAALLTMVFSSFFAQLSLLNNSVENPVKIISMLDTFLEKVVPDGNFITCAFAYVDYSSGKLAVFNCGHTECYLTLEMDGKRKVAALPPKLPPLGMGSVAKELAQPEKKSYYGFAIQSGLHLDLYSDGLTDMKNDWGERYEEEKTKKFFANLYETDDFSVQKAIEKTVSDWCGDARLPDDITVMDLRF